MTDTPSQKLHSLALALMDFTRGTVWKVREAFWKETLGKEYDQNSEKKWHPGLSIRKKQPLGLFEMIPMLHGTTGSSGPVVARGLTPQKKSSHPTSFGHLAPASVQARSAFQGDKIMPAESPAGYWHEHNPIAKNHWKPKLDEVEHTQLVAFLERRNLD